MKRDKHNDQLGERLRSITSDLKLYVEKRIELVLLNTGELISEWMAASIQRVAGALLILGGVSFLLFALAIYLGNVLDNESLGYVLVSLPLLLFGFLFMYLKPKGLLKSIEHMFEAEVIKALKQNGRVKQKKLESSESTRSTKTEEK
jgi:hypothetical protein